MKPRSCVPSPNSSMEPPSGVSTAFRHSDGMTWLLSGSRLSRGPYALKMRTLPASISQSVW